MATLELGGAEPRLEEGGAGTATVSDAKTDGGKLFMRVYQRILVRNCLVRGCHDGSFEPDFRTPYSSWNTLVNHPITKNTLEGAYALRVVPGHPERSWMHYRVTTDDSILGRMPLYLSALDSAEVSWIAEWIAAGAPDPIGRFPVRAKAQPRIRGIAWVDAEGKKLLAATAWDEPWLHSITPLAIPSRNPAQMLILIEDPDSLLAGCDLKLTFQTQLQQPLSYPLALEPLMQTDSMARTIPDRAKSLAIYRLKINPGTWPSGITQFQLTVTPATSKPYMLPAQGAAIQLWQRTRFQLVAR
jgi:hypothetical protein